jgi:glycine cleavage system H lipoate-binding protein
MGKDSGSRKKGGDSYSSEKKGGKNMNSFLGEFQYVDFFAEKSVELILMMVFLTTFAIFWKFVNGRRGSPIRFGTSDILSWFTMRDEFFYHRGHTWAHPEGELIRVGIDDFAQKLIGKCSEIRVPKIGQNIEQGDTGIRIKVDSTTIDVLSPVKGEVVAINDKVISNPELINVDPYGEGWIMMVKPSNIKATLANLLKGPLAKVWLEEQTESLREKMTGELGLLSQDGGVLIPGIAKAIDSDRWETIVKEFLLTD